MPHAYSALALCHIVLAYTYTLNSKYKAQSSSLLFTLLFVLHSPKMRTRHPRTLIQSLCNHRALLLRETKSADLLEMFRRLQSGRESSSSSSSSSRTNDAPSSVRGMHATRTVQLIEDRDGRGLTEEIIEENLVRRRVTMHSVRFFAS